MSKNKTVKIMAILALMGIVISVVGTGILVLTSKNNIQEKKLTKEEIQELIKKNQISITNSGGIEK